MRILFFGDVVGEAGRKALFAFLPDLKEKYMPEVVIVNGENAAHGFGITSKICGDFYEAGVHVITTGNHVWDNKEVRGYIETDDHLLRPLNYPPTLPGRGYVVHKLKDGRKICVANLMGNLYMESSNLAFQHIDTLLGNVPLNKSVQAFVIDMHAETTSEKMALAHFVDGRATAVFGTHTHVPTADARIFPAGLAYITDVGMCGDYHSVIGMEASTPIKRFLKIAEGDRLTPALGPGTVGAIFIESDDQTGRASRIQPIIRGPHLINVG